MTSDAEAHPASAARADLLDRLRERLEQVDTLGVEMRRGLRGADAGAIDSATGRLQSLSLEFRLLAAEYRRHTEDGDAADSPDVAEARARLESAATRLARSAAVGGGLLERLVLMSRQLLGTVHGSTGEAYLPSGRGRETPSPGLRLREEA